MSRILAGALVVAVAMGGTIYWEVQDPATPDLACRNTGTLTLTGIAQPLRAPIRIIVMQSWASTALARPLFREDRRPPKTSDDVVLKGDGPTRLTGVITGTIRQSCDLHVRRERETDRGEGGSTCERLRGPIDRAGTRGRRSRMAWFAP